MVRDEGLRNMPWIVNKKIIHKSRNWGLKIDKKQKSLQVISV
jgi:hypothetical protein